MRNNELDLKKLQFPVLIDIKGTAGLLCVGERYVRRMVDKRQLTTFKVGRLVRFDLEEVRAFVERSRRPPRPEQARTDKQ